MHNQFDDPTANAENVAAPEAEAPAGVNTEAE